MEPKVRKETDDLDYWLSKTPSERIAEVTRLINEKLKPGQRMDKTKYRKITLDENL